MIENNQYTHSKDLQNIPYKCDAMDILEAIKNDDETSFLSLYPKYGKDFCVTFTENYPWFFDGGPSLIQLCAAFGAKKCFNCLLNFKPDLSYTDGAKRSVCHFASISGDIEMLAKLAANDANMNPLDDKNQTCVHYCAKFDRLNAYKFFAKLSKKPNPRNSHGASAFMWACGNASLEFVEYMFQTKQCKVDETTKGRWTPLFYATSSNRPEIVEFLISNGADFNRSLRYSNDKPLDIAYQKDSEECIQVLESYGAQRKVEEEDAEDDEW